MTGVNSIVFLVFLVGGMGCLVLIPFIVSYRENKRELTKYQTAHHTLIRIRHDLLAEIRELKEQLEKSKAKNRVRRIHI